MSDGAEAIDLYGAVGGRAGCLQLSKAFYGRVKQDAALRPFFPGKSLKCAIEAFAAFLAQFLGGPAEDARERWSLSLRESHLRFQIGPREREAWLSKMREALDETPMEARVRDGLQAWFERSSAYIVNTERLAEPAAAKPAGDRVHGELEQRWAEQKALDEIVVAIRLGNARRCLELAEDATLRRRFGRDRAVLAHVLGLMMGNGALREYIERELRADGELAGTRNRYGRTLLDDASAAGDLRMVELVLRLGADPNGKTPARTPLYCVANECHWGGGEIVRALVRAGAQVNAACGVKRCTALHVAARRGNMEVAEALLECGADLNVRDAGGDTPLQRATNCRKAGVAALLAARGADKSVAATNRRKAARAGKRGPKPAAR